MCNTASLQDVDRITKASEPMSFNFIVNTVFGMLDIEALRRNFLVLMEGEHLGWSPKLPSGGG